MQKKKFKFLLLLVPLMSACGIYEKLHSIVFSSASIIYSNSSYSSEEINSSTSETNSSNEQSSGEKSNHSRESYSYDGDGFDLSQYYDGYYTNFSWTNSEDLIKKLHDAMRKNYYPLPYGWEMNEAADTSLDDFEYLDVLYSANHISKESATRTSSWNKEHAFCASLMCGVNTSTATETKGRATDYHNLFAAEAHANSARGNTNYGETSKYSLYEYQSGSNSFGAVFEPGEYDKGRLSRALFYMATMYSVDNETPNSNLPKLTLKDGLVVYPANGQGYTEYAHGSLKDLLEWSYDAVDRLEYQHNEAVCKTKINGVRQGNRNAYVDFPDLVEYAFGDKKDEPGELKYMVPSAEYLHINEPDIANYAIKKAKRFYQIGDALNYSDIELVAVNNDFSTAPVTNFIIQNISDGTVLNEGTHTLKIETDINDIEYTVTVGNDYFATSTYSHTFTSQEIKKGTTYKAGDLNLNIDWANSDATVGGIDGNNNRGVQIGSSSKPTGDLTIKVTDSLQEITGIYLKCGVASGIVGSVKFFVNENLIKETQIRYTSGQASLAICEPDSALSGNIKIVINCGNKASYVNALAVKYGK